MMHLFLQRCGMLCIIIYVSRYTLVLVWYVDFVWFCVFEAHYLRTLLSYLGSWLDEFLLHIHTCYHQNAPKSKPRVFPKNPELFLMSYSPMIEVFIAFGFSFGIHVPSSCSAPPRSTDWPRPAQAMAMDPPPGWPLAARWVRQRGHRTRRSAPGAHLKRKNWRIFHDFSCFFCDLCQLCQPEIHVTLAGHGISWFSQQWLGCNPHMDRPGFDPSYLNNNSEITWVKKWWYVELLKVWDMIEHIEHDWTLKRIKIW